MSPALLAVERVQLVWTTLVGACLGSFVNVVVARLPRAESVVRPRSRCLGCLTPIAWYDNLPLVSWLVLRGRCRHCRARIAPRYVLVELLMAGLAAALFVRFGFTYALLFWMPLTAALLAVVFLDIDHWWVPDAITYPGLAWALGLAWLPGRPGLVQALLGLGPAVLLAATGWAFARLTRREGLGLGDVKLLALLGLCVGLQDSLTVLLLASLQGAGIGTLVLLAGGHRSPPGPPPAALADDADWQPPARAVPFGPFLVLAALEVVLLPEAFVGWHHGLVVWLGERLL